MNKSKQSFTDYYAEKSLDFLGVLCTMGNHEEFQIVFTWTKHGGFDVELRDRPTKTCGTNIWKTELQQVSHNLWMWNEFAECVQREARKLYRRRADDLISAKLSAAFIYMNAVQKLSRKQIQGLSFIGGEHRNNELHYLFRAGEKEVDVHFKGAVMDKYLAGIANEARQSQAECFYTTEY